MIERTSVTEDSVTTDTTDRRQSAMDIVARSTLYCAVATRLPFWWATSPSITGLQLKMLSEISSVYGVEFNQDLAKPMIASVAGGILNLVISENPLTLMLKTWVVAIPVVGIPLRFGIGPVTVAAYTYVLGRAFIRHYEAGGTYHDFSVANFRTELSEIVGLEPVEAVTLEAPVTATAS